MKRATKAQALLDSIAGLNDPQVALLLLRQCASFGKLVYSARSTKFDHHMSALSHFDTSVRACFDTFTGIHTSDSQWARATLPIRSGGIGLRSLSSHAAAAYLASRSACHSLCKDLDPQHTWEVEDVTSSAYAAVAHVNSVVAVEDRLQTSVPDKVQQKSISSSIDSASFSLLVAEADPSCRAHLCLQKKKGAGACFVKPPTEKSESQINPELFVTMLKRRLRVPFTDGPFYCPFCDGVCDIYGDHALVCSGGGDRTKRHNLLRNCAASYAARAGLSPEMEKPGLLRPRPLMGARAENGGAPDARGAGARRPADVYIPHLGTEGPTALDFAVTSGLRTCMLARSASDPSAATNSYAATKRSYLDTAQQCHDEGITFIPMVAEGASGGWGDDAERVWSKIARAICTTSGEDTSKVSADLYQSLSLILLREGARAVLRRLPRTVDAGNALASARVALESAPQIDEDSLI